MTERVMIYVDGGNFYKACKNAFNCQVRHFDKLGQHLVGSNNLIRLNFYDATKIRELDETGFRNQQKFHESLKRQDNVKIHLGRIEKRGQTFIEKGVDVKLATHLLAQAYMNAYDIAIIVSGDGDFVDAVEETQRLGKKVWVALVKGQRAFHIQQVCDRVIRLDDISPFR